MTSGVRSTVPAMRSRACLDIGKCDRSYRFGIIAYPLLLGPELPLRGRMKTLKLLKLRARPLGRGRRQPRGDPSAIDGAPVARRAPTASISAAMLRHAREVGGPALRKLTFHERARMIKALGQAVMARKEELYELNYQTGATRKDGWIDIEGGAGHALLLLVEGPARAARRPCPPRRPARRPVEDRYFRRPAYLHPLHGAAVHINAFNFPVWGMLEKLAPTLLAGVPAIVKPASATSYLAKLRSASDRSGVLPPGALQLIVGGVGDLFDHLAGQDVVSFTGSALDRAQAAQHPTSPRESSASSPSRTASTPRCSAPTQPRERPSSTCSSRKSRPR